MKMGIKQLTLISFLFAFFSMQSIATVRTNYGCPGLSDEQKGPGVWPWGNEVNFPWYLVDGDWKTDLEGKALIFRVRSYLNPSFKDRLRILVIDPKTCAVISQSVGRSFDGRIVFAKLKLSNFKPAQWVSLHAFRLLSVLETDLLNEHDFKVAIRLEKMQNYDPSFRAAQMLHFKSETCK